MGFLKHQQYHPRKTNISFAKFIVGFDDLDVSKNRGVSPKWMVKIMENPINPWDDLGGNPTIFGNTRFFPFKMIPLFGSTFILHRRQTSPGQPVRPPDVSDPWSDPRVPTIYAVDIVEFLFLS